MAVMGSVTGDATRVAAWPCASVVPLGEPTPGSPALTPCCSWNC